MNVTKNPTEILASANLENALKSAHVIQIARLMQVVNDLASVSLLRRFIDEQEWSSMRAGNAIVSNGLQAFLTRLECGYLREGVKEFVYKIAPKDQKTPDFFYTFLAADEVLKAKFEELLVLLRDDDFNSLREARNSVLFHYEDDGQMIKDALEAFRRECKANDEEEFWAVYLKRFSEGEVPIFPLGTKVFDLLFQRAMKVPAGADVETDDVVARTRKFRTTLGRKFVEFGELLICKWLDENKLVTNTFQV